MASDTAPTTPTTTTATNKAITTAKDMDPNAAINAAIKNLKVLAGASGGTSTLLLALIFALQMGWITLPGAAPPPAPEQIKAEVRDAVNAALAAPPPEFAQFVDARVDAALEFAALTHALNHRDEKIDDERQKAIDQDRAAEIAARLARIEEAIANIPKPKR